MAESKGSKKAKDPANPRAGYLLALLGLGVFVYGAITTVRLLAFVRDAVPTEGTVVAFEERERVRWQRRQGGNDRQTFLDSQRNRRVEKSYFPSVLFIAQNGQQIEFVSSVGAQGPRFEVGETVPILYDPDAPGTARIGEAFDLWFPSAFLGALGLGWGAGGLLWMRSGKSRASENTG